MSGDEPVPFVLGVGEIVPYSADDCELGLAPIPGFIAVFTALEPNP